MHSGIVGFQVGGQAGQLVLDFCHGELHVELLRHGHRVWSDGEDAKSKSPNRGKIGRRGSREKDITLSIARRLKKLIDAEPNMRALLTRDGDYFLALNARVAKAQAVKADLLVSIHADAFIKPHARGSSVFTLSFWA